MMIAVICKIFRESNFILQYFHIEYILYLVALSLQLWDDTVHISKDFSVIQILREINFCKVRAKNTIKMVIFDKSHQNWFHVKLE